MQLLVVLLWFLGKCRQFDEQELLLDSMEGGTGGPAAWVLLIYYVHPEPLYFFNNVLSS